MEEELGEEEIMGSPFYDEGRQEYDEFDKEVWPKESIDESNILLLKCFGRIM